MEEPINPTPTPDPAVEPAAQPAQQPGGSRLLTVGILLAAVALAGVWIKNDKAKTSSQVPGTKAAGMPKVGSPAPKLVLKDLDGKTVTLEDLKGKVVLVDYWATWCEPCQIMIPWLVDFRRRYGNQGFEIVGVAMDDDGATSVRPFVQKNGMNYTIVLGTDDAAEAWGGVYGLPTSFLIDRQGRIQSTHQGLVGKDVIEKDIRSLL